MLKVLNVKVFACMRMKTNSFKIKYPQIKYIIYTYIKIMWYIININILNIIFPFYVFDPNFNYY